MYGRVGHVRKRGPVTTNYCSMYMHAIIEGTLASHGQCDRIHVQQHPNAASMACGHAEPGSTVLQANWWALVDGDGNAVRDSYMRGGPLVGCAW